MYNVLHVYEERLENVGGQLITKIRADISVSTVSNLPNDEKLLVDSIALVRQAGEFYIKDEDGKWYANGEEAS